MILIKLFFFINNSFGLNSADLSVGSNESVAEVYRYLGEYYGYSAQQSFMAYQSYLINYDESNNNLYEITVDNF